MFSEGAARLAGLASALLGWSPAEFWRTTPAEMAAIIAALAGKEGQAVTSTDLDRLMEKFPDG